VGHRLGRQRGDRAQHVHLAVPHIVGAEGDRRLHRHQAEQLQQVVLQHVAQGARALVVEAATLHAERLRHGDLHVVDVRAVPDRLEQPVGEAQDQDVLDGLLAQIVVDAEDLLLAEVAVHPAVERQGRGQVAAEGLFDHDPGEGVRAGRGGRGAGQSRPAEVVHDAGIERRRGGQVEQAVGRDPLRAEAPGELGVGRRIPKVPGDVVNPARAPASPLPGAPEASSAVSTTWR